MIKHAIINRLILSTSLILVINACDKDQLGPLAPSLPLILPIEFVEGTQYIASGSVDPSPNYEESYTVLRDYLWNTFVNSYGEPCYESAIGNMGFAEVYDLSGEEQGGWNMRYEGYKSKFVYSLPSRAGYTSASISIIITRRDLVGEFLPCRLEIKKETTGNAVIFGLDVHENYPFNTMIEYDMSQGLGYLGCGNNVTLIATTELFRWESPLPVNAPPWQGQYEYYWYSNVCGIIFYITLYPQ